MSPNAFKDQRRGLLALVHIAKKQLGLTEDEYLGALSGFGVASAGALSVPELEGLVEYFKSVGFKRLKVKGKGLKAGQAAALRARIRDEAGKLENGEARLEGLVRKTCGVDRLEWVRDPSKLKRVLRTITAFLQYEADRRRLEYGS